MVKKIILFRHISKTAGTTFKFILSNNFGSSYCNSMAAKPSLITPNDKNILKFFYPRLKAIGGHNLSIEGDFLSDKYFRITFIREPIARTISDFQYFCRRDEDIDKFILKFKTWINNPKNQNQQIKKIGLTDNFDLAIKNINNTYDFIGLTENFDRSLQILKQICPIKLNLKYNKKQISKNKELANRIKNSQECMNLIKQHNQLDIRLYDYVLENYYERDYLKNYSFNKDLRFDVLQNKHTFLNLMSMWYNKYIFRTYFKIFNKNRLK